MGASNMDIITESLLPVSSSDTHAQQLEHISSDVIEELLGQEKNVPCEWWALIVGWELRQLWTVSATSVVVCVFNFLLIFVIQMFAGHLGSLELAGASIASIEIQGLAVMIMFGMAFSVQKQCSQAYANKNYASLGIICQKAIIVHLGTAVFFSILYWYSGTVLQAMGIWSGIAYQAQIFARGLIPQLFAFALNSPLQRFLQAQNIVTPLAYISVGVFLLHIFLTWLVVAFLNYGLLGAALTLSFSWWVLVIITGLYITFSPACQKTWTGFSAGAFQGLCSQTKLALESIAMINIEILYSLGLVLAASYLPNPIVSVNSFAICLNYLNLSFMVMLGLSTAATIRVSTELEGAHPRVARLSTIVVNATGIIISLIFIVLVFASGTTLSKGFSSNNDVIDGVSSLTPLLAISILINGVEPILSGVAIGTGRSTLGVYGYLITYYIIGLSIASGLAFMTNLGAKGLWWGMIIGFFLQSLFLFVLIVRTDWDEVGKTCEDLKRYVDEESLA